jgi:hypothetical protein
MNTENCKLEQCNLGCIQNWPLDNGMKLNTGKTAIILLACKSNTINYNNEIYNNPEAHSQCVKGL